MKKPKATVTRTASELAAALGLSPADGLEIEIRSNLNDKIIEGGVYIIHLQLTAVVCNLFHGIES